MDQALEYNQKKIKYLEMVKEPEFNEMTRAKQEELIGVDRQTLWRWSKEVNWEEVRDISKKKYAQEAPEVFGAIKKRAVRGDGKSQELYLKYFLGWSDKQIHENLNKNVDLEGLSPEELTEKALAGIPAEVLERVLARKAAKIDGGTGNG